MQDRLVRLIAICAIGVTSLGLVVSISTALHDSYARNAVLSEANAGLRARLDTVTKELRDTRRAYDTVLSQKDYVQKMYDDYQVRVGAYVQRLIDEVNTLKKDK